MNRLSVDGIFTLENRRFNEAIERFSGQHERAKLRVDARVVKLRCASGIYVMSFLARTDNPENDPKSLSNGSLVRMLVQKDEILLTPRVPCYGNGVTTGNRIRAVLDESSYNASSPIDTRENTVACAFPEAIYDLSTNVIYFFERKRDPRIVD